MGRPDGVRSHTLPAGRYQPVLEDERGVFFESPDGLALTQPGLRGTRSRPGGIYVAREGRIAWQYLGDADGISSRERLPLACRFAIEPAEVRERAAPPGGPAEPPGSPAPSTSGAAPGEPAESPR